MPKTVQIRDLDDDVYAALQRQAAFERMSVPEYLRREATRLASRPSMKEWEAGVARLPRLDMSDTDVNEILDELRGPWPDPDAGR